jgi:hypothetical protein
MCRYLEDSNRLFTHKNIYARPLLRRPGQLLNLSTPRPLPLPQQLAQLRLLPLHLAEQVLAPGQQRRQATACQEPRPAAHLCRAADAAEGQRWVINDSPII